MHRKQPATSNQQLAEGDQQLAAGVRLFNEQRFFEAHEAWEELWLASKGEDRIFLQGLIQLAAAYHHLQRGTVGGAGRLFDAAIEKLSRVPPRYRGVDCANAITCARGDRSRLLEGHPGTKNYPKIRYN